MADEWKEISPGVFERPFDAIERSMSALTSIGHNMNREFSTGTSGLILNITTSEWETSTLDILRQAWTALRYEQPMLATTVDRLREVRQYRTASSNKDVEICAWLAETFRVDSSLTSKELFPLLRKVDRPVLYVLTKTQEVLLRNTHMTNDGLGIVGLWDDFLRLIVSPREIQFGDEAKNLPPSLAGGLEGGLPDPTPEDVQFSKEEIGKYGFQPKIRIPCIPATSPADPQLFRTSLSLEQTQSIIRIAKEWKCSPTHFTTAALILAAKKLSNTDASFYGTSIQFNLRRWLRPEVRRFSIHNYLATWYFLTEPGDFRTTVQQAKDFFTSTANDRDRLRALAPTLDYLTSLIKTTTSAPIPVRSAGEPMLNSYGLLDNTIKQSYSGESENGRKVDVKDFWVCTENLNPNVSCFFYTWGGLMKLDFCYNSAYYTRDAIDEFHRAIVDILLEGLELTPNDAKGFM